MGLFNRLIGAEDPSIPVHTWPKLFDLWKRSRVDLTQMLDAYNLTDKTQQIASFTSATDKVGLSIDHTWADDDGVYFTTTGSLPTNLETETVYYVINSNPTQGTVKVSTEKAGAAVNFVGSGTGTSTLHRIDADVIRWDEIRKDVTSTNGLDDQKLRRRIWDEIAEGVGEVAEEGIDFTTAAAFEDELEATATWLTVS